MSSANKNNDKQNKSDGDVPNQCSEKSAEGNNVAEVIKQNTNEKGASNKKLSQCGLAFYGNIYGVYSKYNKRNEEDTTCLSCSTFGKFMGYLFSCCCCCCCCGNCCGKLEEHKDELEEYLTNKSIKE